MRTLLCALQLLSLEEEIVSNLKTLVAMQTVTSDQTTNA